jgi:hypothetical protein
LKAKAVQGLRRQVLYALGVQFRHIATELAPAVHRGLESDVLGEKVLLEIVASARISLCASRWPAISTSQASVSIASRKPK